MYPGIKRNPISAKVDFCNTSNSKCLVLQFQTSGFKPKILSEKVTTKIQLVWFQGARTTSKTGSLNPPKINKKRSLDLKVFFLVLPNVPGLPRVPQDAKAGAEGMPNNTSWTPKLIPSAPEISIATACGHQRSSTNCSREICEKKSKKQQAKVKGPAARAKP